MKKQWKGFLTGLVAGVVITSVVGISVGGEALQGSLRNFSKPKAEVATVELERAKGGSVATGIAIPDDIIPSHLAADKDMFTIDTSKIIKVHNPDLTRAELSELIVEKLGVDTTGYSGCAVDLIDHWAEPYMCYLVDEGYLWGDSAQNIRPDHGVGRAEGAKIASLVFDIMKSYPDVNQAHWYYGYVLALGANDIYNVNDGENFRPADPLRRLEFKSWLNKI
jgi:S-layer homology domain